MRTTPEKIVILGGGVGSMAAAWYLSDQPGWQDRYAITVYQQGWRLGGKGASGRNPQRAQRIEEHGPHVWFGYYGNAFALMKAAYASLARPAGSPLASWREAFAPHQYSAMAEQVGAEWRPWHELFPIMPGEPGPGTPVTLWELGLAMLRWISLRLNQLHAGRAATGPDMELLAQVQALPSDPRTHAPHEHAHLARQLESLRAGLRAEHTGMRASAAGDDVRRLRIAMEIGTTVLKGMFADGAFRDGLDAINGLDLRTWLANHGGDPELCLDSAPVRTLYDSLFAYAEGDYGRPDLEAGTGVRCMMRTFFGYQGSLLYEMQAGMGDAVFAPLYQALSTRGVSFRFFHELAELVPDGDAIGSIRVTRQVALKDCGYDPLVTVKGLDCWPSVPRFSQIDVAQAALLQEHQVDLESYWSDWPALYRQAFGAPLPELTLERGRDFDHVVFGIPLGAVPELCPQLLARSPALRAASDKVRTVSTQAYQVWLNQDLAQLGWTYLPNGQAPVLGGFSKPYDTWLPAAQLVAREDWPADLMPKGISYFCSVLPVASYPPRSDSGFPARCAALAKAGALEHLDQRIGALWPAAGRPGAFPWQWLVDPADAVGPRRFDSQYWRANVGPSERYVQSLAGSARYRLKADESGFSNLYLAGDWLKTGLDFGCIEGAVMGGMQAARALSGYPEKIEGESDF